jgi:hypothetical protein
MLLLQFWLNTVVLICNLAFDAFSGDDGGAVIDGPVLVSIFS